MRVGSPNWRAGEIRTGFDGLCPYKSFLCIFYTYIRVYFCISLKCLSTYCPHRNLKSPFVNPPLCQTTLLYNSCIIDSQRRPSCYQSSVIFSLPKWSNISCWMTTAPPQKKKEEKKEVISFHLAFNSFHSDITLRNWLAHKPCKLAWLVYCLPWKNLQLQKFSLSWGVWCENHVLDPQVRK